jgi:hypothetical protein
MSDALQRAGSSGVILVENDLPDHYAESRSWAEEPIGMS